jgi:hypothetical protein
MFSFALFLRDDNRCWKVLQLFVRGKKFICPPKRPDVLAYQFSYSVATSVLILVASHVINERPLVPVVVHSFC